MPKDIKPANKKSSPVVTEQDEQPAPKRIRLYREDDDTIDEEEYDEAVEKLQQEYKSKRGKKTTDHSLIKNLVEKMKLRRHQWIHQDRPLILEILDKFPYLSTSRWVS